jgi:phosphohistidine phosphatase
MRLYLVQHGQALTKEENPDRPLSPTGQDDIERLAGFLKAAGITVHQTLHSGKTRAQQTADILALSIMPKGENRAIDGLAPNDPTDQLVELSRSWDQDSLLVGHLPYMAHLVSRLVGQEERSTITAFQPGTLVGVEKTAPDQWEIILMLRPEHLTHRGPSDD